MEAHQLNNSTIYGLKGHKDTCVAISPEQVERLKEIVLEYGDLSKAPPRLTVRGTFVKRSAEGGGMRTVSDDTNESDVTVCELLGPAD
jgi:hypothetical protein